MLVIHLILYNLLPQEHISHASSVLSDSVGTIDGFRRRGAGLGEMVGRIVGRQDYNQYTETECHAELVYAECLLLKVLLES